MLTQYALQTTKGDYLLILKKYTDFVHKASRYMSTHFDTAEEAQQALEARDHPLCKNARVVEVPALLYKTIFVRGDEEITKHVLKSEYEAYTASMNEEGYKLKFISEIEAT